MGQKASIRPFEAICWETTSYCGTQGRSREQQGATKRGGKIQFTTEVAEEATAVLQGWRGDLDVAAQERFIRRPRIDPAAAVPAADAEKLIVF